MTERDEERMQIERFARRIGFAIQHALDEGYQVTLETDRRGKLEAVKVVSRRIDEPDIVGWCQVAPRY